MFWLNFKDLVIWDIVEVLIAHKSAEWETLNPLELRAFTLSLQRQCQAMAAALGNNPASISTQISFRDEKSLTSFTQSFIFTDVFP